MSKIVIFANGKPIQIEPGTKPNDLMRLYQLDPSAILLERNGEVIFRNQWDTLPLEHGDRVEMIRVVAGG